MRDTPVTRRRTPVVTVPLPTDRHTRRPGRAAATPQLLGPTMARASGPENRGMPPSEPQSPAGVD